MSPALVRLRRRAGRLRRRLRKGVRHRLRRIEARRTAVPGPPTKAGTLVAHVRRVHWDGDRLVLGGWAFLTEAQTGTPPELSVRIGRGRFRLPVRLPVQLQCFRDEEVNTFSGDENTDRAECAFTVTLDLSRIGLFACAWLRTHPGRRLHWPLTIRCRMDGWQAEGPLNVPYRQGSAAVLTARRIPGGVWGRGDWSEDGFAVLTTAADPGPQFLDGGLPITDEVLLISDVRVRTGDGVRLIVEGRLPPRVPPGLTVALAGVRNELPGESVLADGTSFRAEIPLIRTDRWGHPGLAPINGGYRLHARAGGTELPARVSNELAGQLYQRSPLPGLMLRLEREPRSGALQVNVASPIPDGQAGKYHQKRMKREARLTTPRPADLVYLQSFIGKFAACNPRALAEEIRRRDPGLRLCWGIRDYSVPVPPGTEAVIINSQEWWDVRHAARYLIINDWLNPSFTKRDFQTVVQTWHGTPFKTVGLDRPDSAGRAGFRRAVARESAKWDYLLTENAYSVDRLSRAYAFEGTVLESGYPRNDVLHGDRAGAVRERLRGLLGVADRRVVLYAPTWRDDRPGEVTDLDLAALAARLGNDYVLLMRGHANMLRGNADSDAAAVIDVTSYPEPAELYLAADLAITDYSSVMFDFAGTGKPLLFFVPDYERYASRVRGVYFDLAASAPGPLIHDVADLPGAIRSADRLRLDYDDRYRAWQQTYTAWDDGAAAARVIDRVFGSSHQAGTTPNHA